MAKLAVLQRVIATRRSPVTGVCTVCGRMAIFVWVNQNPRDGLVCPFCRSNARHRLVAKAFLEYLGSDARSLRRLKSLDRTVYVADTGGPVARTLRGFSPVSRSALVPDVPLGARLPGGATCQDLEELTYADASFDVVMTEDVLEHVRRPDVAFREIGRVLRLGGVHIFTVPFVQERPTVTRIDTSGPEDVELMEPEWHGDSIRGRVIAYRNFGYDLFELLSELGFETSLRKATFRDRREGIFNVEVFVSRRVSSD